MEKTERPPAPDYSHLPEEFHAELKKVLGYDLPNVPPNWEYFFFESGDFSMNDKLKEVKNSVHCKAFINDVLRWLKEPYFVEKRREAAIFDLKRQPQAVITYAQWLHGQAMVGFLANPNMYPITIPGDKPGELDFTDVDAEDLAEKAHDLVDAIIQIQI